MKRAAVIGDVHGCFDEFQELYQMLLHESLDEIRHAGDLVDRGPDSGAVVDFCRRNKISGVVGNHESVLLERFRKGLGRKLNEDKERTFASIRNPADWDYLSSLPHLHVDDTLRTVYVHGGLYPGINLTNQPPKAVTTVQLIRPNGVIGETRWFGVDTKGRTEAENRAEGWVRWYELCDHPYTVVYGHSVYESPLIYKNTIGIDTGCVFGGRLTAVILPERKFISIPAKRQYWDKGKGVVV